MKFNGDLNEVMQNTASSVHHYGSEFRSVSDLETLLSPHPKWTKFKDIIQHGVKYPSSPISDEDRLADIDFHLERGNHKSALSEEGTKSIDKAFTKEVKHGWQIPILPSVIKSLKGAGITPLGTAKQWTMDENNEDI